MTTTSKWERMAVLSPARSGELQEQKSMFDDCWGTVVDLDIRMEEDQEDGTFYNQLFTTVKIDNTDLTFDERTSLPTNKETGELLRDENGALVRPNKNSKYGQQEILFNSLGIPWEGLIENIMGLHGHWLRKGVRKTREDIAAEKAARDRGEKVKRDWSQVPYGRYLIEWDKYDNEIRRLAGLPAITVSAASLQRAVEEVQGPSGTIEDVADGLSFIQLINKVRSSHKGLQPQATRDNLSRLVTEGILRLDDSGIYHKVGGE